MGRRQDDEVGLVALGEPRRAAEPRARVPGGGAERFGRGHPDAVQGLDLVPDQAVRERAAGVGAGVDRHARLVRGPQRRGHPLVQPAHVRRVRRELALALRGVRREVRDLDQRRDQRDLALGHDRDQVVGDAGAVLEAVDPGGEEVGQ